MIKACIYPKSRQGQILKRMNCAKVLCVWSNMYIIWKQTFDGSKMLKGGDNQGFIYLPQY